MRTRLMIVSTLLTCGLAGAASAQQTAPTPAPPAPAARPATPVAPAPPAQPAPPARLVTLAPPAQLANIRFEVVITESGSTPAKKTVGMIVADGGRGSVRTFGVTDGGPGPNPKGGGQINVDARPRIERNGLIRAGIVVEYQNKVNVQFDSLLESGKTVIVSEAPDPGSDSTVTVAVTATILK